MVKDLNDPTNRDSVPAMLTPGEFVLNKEATMMFGPAIEAMNNAGLQQRHTENQMVMRNTGGIVDHIKKEEGFRNKAYKDPVGIWTIGYGRTTNSDGSPVKPGQTTSRDAEDSWIVQRVAQEKKAVEEYGKKHGYNWGPAQIDALASFRYNGGHGMLEQLTGGGKRDNETIANKMLQYNKGTKDGKKVELPGLTKRRKAEHAIFTGSSPAPRKEPQAEVPQPQSAPPAPQPAATPAPQPTAPPTPQPEASNISLGLPGLGAEVLGAIQANPGPDLRHTISRSYTQPEYIPSSAVDKPISSRQRQAPQQFNTGGWLSSVGNFIFGDEDERAARAEALKRRPGFRPQPEVQTRGPVAPAPPSIDQAPPLPGSDEAILQGSSDAQANRPMPPAMPQQDLVTLKAQLDAMPPDQQDAALNNLPPNVQDQLFDLDTAQYNTNEALRTSQLQQAVTAPDAPGAEFIDSRVSSLQDQMGELGVPPESQGVGVDLDPAVDPSVPPQTPPGLGLSPADVGAVPGIDQDSGLSPDFFDERKEGTADQKWDKNPEKLAETVTSLAESEPDAPPIDTQVEQAGGSDAIEAAGQTQSKNPGVMQKAMGTLKQAFGELFDKKELARAAIMYLGARATGMSGNSALAFAGEGYLQRLDARETTYQKVATSGKYSPESIRVFKESNNPADLVPLGAQPERTGKFETKYTTNGKKVVVEEVKVGDNTIYVDRNGKQISGFDLEGDPSSVRGTKEYRDRVKGSTAQISKQLEEMRKTFDVFDKQSGAAKTDILPSTSSQKIAEWAIDNGVNPDELGGLVESAYHDALNDKRQDGARARSLVPYLNQLVVRQQVGGNADVFKAKGGEGFVNPRKLKVLNTAVANTLKGMGKQGGVNDLSNLFYTEALKDWNALPKDVREQWDRKARKDESGFYLFASDMITTGGL